MKGKARFIHENSSGYYRVSAYFISILLLDLIPKRIIPLSVGGTIMYFMMGFQENVSKLESKYVRNSLHYSNYFLIFDNFQS